MRKPIIAINKAAVIFGIVALSSGAHTSAVGQEKDKPTVNTERVESLNPFQSITGKKVTTNDAPGGAQNVIELENGAIVPGQRLDGRATKRSATGGVIYGLGVYVTSDGRVRSSGKVVKKLAPGESLSIDELEGWSSKGPASRGRPERSTTSRPPVGSSDIPGSPSGYPASPSSTGTVPNPAGAGVASGVGSAPVSPGNSRPSSMASRGKSTSGEGVFVLGNGTQVPSDLGNGVVGTPNKSGGVDYSDGRSANVDPATGDTVFANADGSENTRYTPAREGMGTSADGKATESFVMPNGNHVPREQGGGTGVPNDSGGVSYPDGSYTEYDSESGETVFFDNKGTEIDRAGSQQAYPSTTSDGGSIYVMTNGQAVPRTGPDGQAGTPNANGGVDYAGGTSINPTDDGRTVVTGSPSGNYISVTNSTDGNGNATFDLGNGTSVPASGAGGQGQIAADGAGVVYQDGTFVSVDAKTGETIVQHPGGSSEIMRGDNNRKDAANYVYTASGGSSGSNSGSDSGGKKDSGGSSSSGSSGGKDDKGDKSDDDKGSKDQDSDDDKGDDSGTDDKGDDSGKDEGKDADDKGGADKNVVADGDPNNSPEGKKTVDDALARKTGDKKEPDTGSPPTCEEGRGGPPGGVAQPGPGQQGCVPGGLQRGEEDDDDAEPAPVLNAPVVDGFKRDAIKPDDRVGQPGIDNDRLSNDGRTLDDKLQDIEGVINPKP